MHILILGITTCGKTTLAKHLAREYQRQGIPVLVCDPIGDPEWNFADFNTNNPSKFLKAAKASNGCMLFIDESGDAVGKYNEEMFWLATASRHNGHVSHFICQRFSQINRTVRDQCTTLFCFRQSDYDAQLLARDWANNGLQSTSHLAKYEFVRCSRFGRTDKFIVTLTGIEVSRDRTLPAIDGHQFNGKVVQ